MGLDNSMFGNQVITFPGDFDLATSHQMLASVHQRMCVIMFYQEITKERHDDFQQYVDKVGKGDPFADGPIRFLKLVKTEE